MSTANHDSELNLLKLPGEHPVVPARQDVVAELIVISLNSQAPLPPLVAQVPVSSTTNPAPETHSGGFWLSGDVLMCACPDCTSPMSVRLWLMVADCWRCGTSIELTEEQEREVQRLLAKGAAPAPQPPSRPVTTPPATAAIGPTLPLPATPSIPSQPPSKSVAAPPPPPTTPVPPAPPFRGAPPSQPPTQRPARPAMLPFAPHDKIHPLDRRRIEMAKLRGKKPSNWLSDLFGQMPAWLLSMLFHIVMITILALLTFHEEKHDPFITLSTVSSRDIREGEFKVKIDEQDELVFDMPVPDNLNLKDKKVRDLLFDANEKARELRLDPNVIPKNLPDIQQVKKLAASDDPVRRGLAVRDPRIRVVVGTKEGATTLTEAAVARGLRWLALQQKSDGHWDTHGAAWSNAETSLALLPFLGAGQTPQVGRYQETVSKGLRWLIAQQKPNGDLRGGEHQHPGMYGHGIAAIVLCDAFAMTGDESLRLPAQKSIDFILAAQGQDGGWRYFPKQPGDLSVVGWQLMAIQSARSAGLKIPQEHLEMADYYLDSVSQNDGALYSYQRGSGASPAMTAEGLLCRMYLGWQRDNPGLTRGVELLAKNHMPDVKAPNLYYWYYATQVFHHYGGEPWENWNQKMRDILVLSQVTSGNDAGSWNSNDPGHGNAGGKIYFTSLSICTLEVYYRHAPIYRKINLDGQLDEAAKSNEP